MSDATVCPINITAAGRRRRMVLGTGVLVASLGLLFYRPHPLGSWQMWVGIVMLIYGWLCVMQAVMRT